MFVPICGPAKYQGYWDKDDDGINDEEDKCPTQASPKLATAFQRLKKKYEKWWKEPLISIIGY